MSIATEVTRLQNAKASIKTAITNKGVTVPDNKTLSDYNGYISQIVTDPSGPCTATNADILNGKTAYAGGQLRTGSMANRGAVSNTITTQNGTYTIPAGYHNGSGVVKATLAVYSDLS